MEKRLQRILEDMTWQEVDVLLQEGIGLEAPSGAAERIKASVMKKAGLDGSERQEWAADRDMTEPMEAAIGQSIDATWEREEGQAMDRSQKMAAGQGMYEPQERAAGLQQESAAFRPVRTISGKSLKWRKITACAAVLAFALIVSLSAGQDFVLAAIQKVFHFIPGYGIVEDDSEKQSNKLQYMLEAAAIAENDQLSVALHNALASKNTITVMLDIQYKPLWLEHQIKQEQKKELETHSAAFSARPVLHTKNNEYAELNGYGEGGSDGLYRCTYTYEVEPDEIGTDVVYTLAWQEEDINLSVDFSLKQYESFASLDEIGATDIHNDISITAVAEEKDGGLQVELYPINSSTLTRPEELSIYSFAKNTYGYQGDDLHLLADGVRKEYQTADSFMNPNTRFTFDADASAQELVLKIPYILAQSREEQTVKLKIPDFGEKITVNQRVSFNGCDLIITDMQRINLESGAGEHLKMNFVYENHTPGKVLVSTGLTEVGLFGKWIGGGGSYEMDENGITSCYYFSLEEGHGSTIRLRFNNPVFYLTDEYILKLK